MRIVDEHREQAVGTLFARVRWGWRGFHIPILMVHDAFNIYASGILSISGGSFVRKYSSRSWKLASAGNPSDLVQW